MIGAAGVASVAGVAVVVVVTGLPLSVPGGGASMRYCRGPKLVLPLRHAIVVFHDQQQDLSGIYELFN